MTRLNHHRPRPRIAEVSVVIALVIAVSACNNGSDEPKPLPPETSSTTPTETPTPESDANKVTAVVEHFLDVRDEAYRTLKVTRELNKVATNDAHSTVQVAIQNFRDGEIEISGEYVHTLRPPKKVSATTYEVVDCEDRTNAPWMYRGRPVEQTAPDGSPLANPRPIRYRIEFTSHPGRPDGADRWLVTEILWMGNRTC